MERNFTNVLIALATSRKVLLAVAGVIGTLVLHYAEIDPEVWAAIDALLIAVIAGIAHEDAATKRSLFAALEEVDGDEPPPADWR